ncbi:hypothetical protein BJ912DRAFT_658898 [Pholiota molesta]|nr:hypothetical protein BJ912DRAFT_658898 [Pholiota molesta]
MSYTYQFIPGHFAHDDTDETVVAVPDRFGLKDSSDQRWHNLFEHIRTLNEEAPENIYYKFSCFLVMDNLAETKYGTHNWDDYWSKLETDGELVWGPDPLLTPLGIEQRKTFTPCGKESSYWTPCPSQAVLQPAFAGIGHL